MATRTPKPASTIFVHPLTSWALAQFTDTQRVHDRTTLAVAMGTPSRPTSAANAYRTVAFDILENLSFHGHIEKEPTGWYRKVAPTG